MVRVTSSSSATSAPEGGAPPPRGYAGLLRTPGGRAFTAAALLGRMPISMLGIGTVLLVEDRRGSYALAGIVSAAYALGLAALGPLGSRLVDRLGQRRVLPAMLVATAAAVVGLVLLTGTDAPAWTLVAVAAVTSLAPSQLGSCVRARWSATLGALGREAEVPRAYAWEAVADEVVFVLGPLLVVAGALVDPAVGLGLALLLCVTGTSWLVAQRATEPPVLPVHGPRGRSALRARGLPSLVLSLVFVGVLFGTIEVSMIAFAEERGSTSGSGLLLALVALGSVLAGLAYGAFHLVSPLPRRYLLSLVGLALGLLPLLLAPSVPLMAPAALLAGIAISPTLIAAFAFVDVLVPAPARTEGFSWLNSGLGLGVAGGFAASGAVADASGARTAFLVALAAAVAAALTALVARSALAPAQEPAGSIQAR
jgi:MFS family permease